MCNRDKQIRVFVQKQKQLIAEATEQEDKDYIAMMWLGYLNGLRLTNAISYAEYKDLYNEIQLFAAGADAA